MPRFDVYVIDHATLCETILDETIKINNYMYEINTFNELIQRHRDDIDICTRWNDIICKNLKKQRASTKKICLCKAEKLRRERMALRQFMNQ